MTLDKLLSRRFTKALEGSKQTVYDLFTWKKVEVVLKNYATGEVMTDMRELEFPEQYTQSACDIIATKYFRKRGVKGELSDRDSEYSMKQVAHRMTEFWVNAMLDSGLITPEQKVVVYDELVYMLLDQRWAPNSPQWFNTGLGIYGITGNGSGHYYVDSKTKEVKLAEDAYSRTQGSACFITSVSDSLLGDKSLTDQITTETLLFKYGSGVGSNWSTIRAKGERLSGGGKSSGLLSFLKVSDRNAGAIKSGGTTRRAAKMNMLDLDHPEILEYIDWKAQEEDKVVALGKMGYSTHFEGEAYETVSGQNANNSVRVSDAFMKQVGKENAMWQTKGRMDSSVDKEIPVKEIWDRMAYAAWRSGDPGIQYDDTINAWHTTPAGEDGKLGAKYNRINGSNPCSEYMFLDDTACNLASINLMKYYDTDHNTFANEDYLHTILMVQMVLEATIHFGQFPTRDIARKSHVFRTTGIGYTNLGTLLMVMGLPYDSDQARSVAAALASTMTGYSYYASAVMAEKIGAFEAYNMNKSHMLRVIKNHGAVAGYHPDAKLEGLNYQPVMLDHEMLNSVGVVGLSETVKLAWDKAITHGIKHGYRNAQVSVLAPTGTIAFAMDCASTSSEPFFSHVAYKKLVGGGFMVIANPAMELALKKLGYTTAQIKDIVDYVMAEENGMVVDGKIEGAPHLKDEHLPVFDTANKCGTGERFIAPDGHMKMMGALTPHLTGAISKTVNLPVDATVEEIADIHARSWELGIKAIALYRDNCKASQPLNTVKEDGSKALEDLSYEELLAYAKAGGYNTGGGKEMALTLRDKPKGIREARVHEVEINGIKYYIHATYYNDDTVDDSFMNGRDGNMRTHLRQDRRKLGEIFISAGAQGSLLKGMLDTLSKTISIMLQYGVPAKDISAMYRGEKYEPSGPVRGHPYIKWIDSISDLVSKVIDVELGDYTYCQVKPEAWEQARSNVLDFKKYSAKDIIQGETCINCKSSKLVKSGICKVCTECGTTTGCS